MVSVFRNAARVVNATLGEQLQYQYYDGSDPITTNITINRSTPVTDELRNVIGYEITASVLKEDVQFRPDTRDSILNLDGDVLYDVGRVYQETRAKWYFYLTEA